MPHLVGISGSLRQGSLNGALLRACAALVPDGTTLEIATLAGVPLYDGDLETRAGLPARVVELKARIQAADGLLLVTPEYNASLPGVFKNALDWCSRPSSDISKVFGGKPVALAGATPGGLGTALAQAAWLPVLRALGTRPWFGGRLSLSKATALFAPDGALTDEPTRQQVRAFLAGFAAAAAGLR